MKTDVTFLGRVIRVDSASVEVEVSDDIPSAAPIINGRLYKIGQIGTFVKMPIGTFTIYGIVASVSNTPTFVDDEHETYSVGSRFLSVQLIGEKVGDDEFEKGVGTFPTINDEVHLVVDSDIRQIYGTKSPGSIEIGKHSSSEDLGVFVDLHKFVLRHSAILGSTGSGKSNTTVSILKAILNDYTGSRVLLVDPHGEYSSAFADANVLRINDPLNPLYIPFWLMNFDELAYFLVGATAKEEQTPQYRRLRELIVERKRRNFDKLKAGLVDVNLITADSPIPFNVRELWYELYWWLNASFMDAAVEKQTAATACVDNPGDAGSLTPPAFKPYTVGSAAPYKSKQYQEFYSYEKKLISRLRDSRYDFLFSPGEYKDESSKCDLNDLLSSWIGGPKQLTILDLNGVPPEVLDITVGLITRFIYDSMFWGRNELYTGKNRAILLAYEEAHSYLSKGDTEGYSKTAVEKVFKEGRKFGIGAMVISQRPSESSETILAQVGTFVALRLTNSGDQTIVKASAPDNLISLIDLLPSLRTGEAIVVGEAIKIPSRVRIKLNNPRPTSDDPKLVIGWSKKHEPLKEHYTEVVTAIREKRFKVK
jgi:DNA helicase HerA-like ATPase